jgi:hypothetical protein
VPTTWVSQPGSAALGSPLDILRHAVTMVRSLLRLWWQQRDQGTAKVSGPASPGSGPAKDDEAERMMSARSRTRVPK